jgi:hypothetical protein
VGLERGPLSLVTTTELLERKSSGSGLENREYTYLAKSTNHEDPHYAVFIKSYNGNHCSLLNQISILLGLKADPDFTHQVLHKKYKKKIQLQLK